ncbi:MAG: BA14K family protein [Hoeflea sp.]|uniref:BA14K family protein n=1 Tax=Hoeflea sp. TaxID=1940281 RepID=UPI001E0F3C59|nr:BA14K family protein [Hoeflea sp.]MBU4527207.1 BA14K family protein [Alphaproteobacteria bacterium]MBU4547010.1 BA14K family protein [Alphaproteobacteria bacterium]MBU4551478.1 BA14K family protein [Alphaproteobacteria bacterium]MBV1725483.1 BA14K family protein [Hoeflea sp.]MBV1759531.1 BA14K family protein [Hoeflea sp.]
MKSLAKTIGITLLTAVTALAPLTTAANAGDGRWNRQHYQQRQDMSRLYDYRDYSQRNQHKQNYVYRHGGNKKYIYRDRRNNDALVLGIIGLGAAAIIGGAIANSHNNPQVIYRQPHTPRNAGGAYQPWSQSWMRYCSNKYRSFNPSTGTYRGYDGRDHFCVVN